MSAKELLALRKKEKQGREAREREERERSERGAADSDEDEGEKGATAGAAVATAVAAVAETMRSPAVMEVSSSLKHEKAGGSRSLSRASSSASRYSVYLLYWYKSANTDSRVCACI